MGPSAVMATHGEPGPSLVKVFGVQCHATPPYVAEVISLKEFRNRGQLEKGHSQISLLKKQTF
jgi:hypothetical protein